MSPIPDRIRWYDDMLVTPEHVEEVSRRLEALVRAVPGRCGRFAWGVVPRDGESAFAAAIDDRTLTIIGLDAVMPDGRFVAVTEETALQLDLRPHLDLRQPHRLMVHLAATPEGPVAPGTRRFVSAATAGELIGDDGLPVERRASPLQLFAGDAPANSAYASFPLLEVGHDGGTLTITDFIAPMLQVPSSHPLVGRCREVADRLRQEVAAVANRSIDDGRMPFRTDTRVQINPVLAALPAFDVIRESAPHPFSLYVELCRLAGAAAGLRDHVAAPQVPAYSHDDLRATFDGVFRFLLGDAAPALAGRTASFAFERDGRWFRLTPEPLWREALATGARQQVVLAIEADTAAALAAGWGENCVIGSRSVMSSLLARRVLGLGRRRVHGAAGVTRQRDTFLFRLEPDSDIVRAGEDLLVLGDLPNVTPKALTLHVIAPEPSRADA